jgi:dTDP-4-dehydrorhamnose reductase
MHMHMLIGADAEIGAATARHLSASGLPFTATTRRPGAAAGRIALDLERPLDSWKPPDGVDAACIFVAVARLAACEADPAGSSYINVTQTLALADRLVSRGIYTLFLSTNQVFDGETAHVPAEAPHCPVSEYGRQKARAEAGLQARMASGEPIGILRLAKVVSPDMALIRNWRQELGAGREIQAFHDMSMAPTPVDLVATAIGVLLDARRRGIAQLTGPRDVSYLAVGRRVAGDVGADTDLVKAVSAHASGMPPGATPRHTTLDSSLMREMLDREIPDAWDVIDAILEGRRDP